MGTTCKYCGHWVEFYTDTEGRVIPYGCRCTSDSSANEFGVCVDEARLPRFDPQELGPLVVQRPLTYKGKCPVCGEPVFWHTNGFGDWVLLEEPFPPWDVHPCWTDLQEEKKLVAVRASTGTHERPAAVAVASTDTGWPQRQDRCWEAAAHCDLDDLPGPFVWDYTHFERSVLQANPRPDSTSCLLSTRVIRRLNTTAPERGVVLVGVETEIGVELYMPSFVAAQFRTGDPIVAKATPAVLGRHRRWVAAWAQGADGRVMDGPTWAQDA
jgi:hypothetical protein